MANLFEICELREISHAARAAAPSLTPLRSRVINQPLSKAARVRRPSPMISAYIPIAIFVVVATGFALFTLVFSSLLHSEKYNKVKLEPYECGIEPVTDARDRYSIRYYLVAMLFVIFDVETVFMFPWAVIFDKLLLFGLIEMLVFIFILVVGYYYAWQKGALEWA
jgi:NADH-quinone oxidoreductase subunit A